MKYTITIKDKVYEVEANSDSGAMRNAAKYLGIELGKLNKLKPELFPKDEETK